ncbi:DUF2931 family protein [Aureibaculum sp. A20]|uniref:DUF2931 family protein n=1 Tax=Aureibaculum flavum TaxID=2795986 RepID=A0ABS0WS78_9FLAO|nr:DUF2931 family protein [Aureibaculum flavum]MBJ2174839.1 DUF2931 family protein [Aureibaculum flavum]
MRIHKLTLVFLSITVILLALNIYKHNSYESWKENKHYYSVAVGFAEYHPVYGEFKLTAENGEDFGLFNESDFGYWGNAYNTDSKFMQLPQTISAQWVALRERKIYKGTFDLPYQKIDSLFRLKNPNKKKFNVYNKNNIYGYTFVIGIEPGGYITLWLEGNYKYQKEIARFKAKTTEEYLENVIEQESMDVLREKLFDRSQTSQLDSIFKNNIPANMEKWKILSKKYNYILQFENFPSTVTAIDTDFFNKERDAFPTNNRHVVKTGVPFSFFFRINKDNNDGSVDMRPSEELMEAFKVKQSTLAINDTLVYLVNYNKSKKSIEGFLTTVNEIKR